MGHYKSGLQFTKDGNRYIAGLKEDYSYLEKYGVDKDYYFDLEQVIPTPPAEA